MSVVFAKIQMRRGTAAQWAAANPVLAQGEMAFETDTGLTKIGDGATAYASLPSYATYDQMLAAKEALDEAALDVAAVEASRVASAASAATASTKANEAAGSAAAALASEQSIVAKVNQAEQARIDAISYAAIAEEKADEIVASANAAAADASAADADRIAAEAARTGSEAAQAISQGAAAGALASEVAADASADVASGAAASALAIYGSVDAQNTAVAVAQAQASLAAGFAASAASVAQQDLSGVTAQALHRSPNAVTAMFLYDTQRDSDGGAWTEKCQHTSWWNEAINGKWLGAQASEFEARNSGATLGAELVTNGDFAAGAAGWTDISGPWAVTNGALVGTNATAGSYGPYANSTAVVAGRTYRVTFTINVTGGSLRVRVGNTESAAYTVSGTYSLFVVATTTGVTVAQLRVGSAFTGTVDNISVREVTALTTASGDYYQSTADGRFYRLWKNLLTWSEDFSNSVWSKAGVTASGARITATAGTGASHVDRGVSNSPATTLTVSCVFPATSGRHRYVWVGDRGVSGPASATFDLDTVSVLGSNAGVTPAVTTLSDGSVRCSITYNRTSVGTSSPQFALAGSSHTSDRPSLTWAGGEFLDAKVQFEIGSAATAYEAKAADGTISEVFRGNKRDFPRLAGIVAEAGNVTIYDLTEPGRPMWMRFNRATSINGIFGIDGGYSYGFVTAFEGRMFVANGDTSGNGYAFGWADFAQDAGYRFDYSRLSLYRGGLSERNGTLGHILIRDYGTALSGCSAIAHVVMPNAPVDPATGLRVPTLLLMGENTYVWTHNNVMRNLSVGASTTGAITQSMVTVGKADGTLYYATNPGLWDGVGAALTRTASQAPGFGIGNTGKHVAMGRSRLLRRSSVAARAQMARAHESDPARSLIATVADTFNTGWMAGDIRRCFLSDTEVGSVTGPELVTNGTFDVDANWSKDAGWSIGGGIASFATTGSGANLTQTISTVPGKTYILSVDLLSTNNQATYLVCSAVLPSQVSPELGSALGRKTFAFVATGTTTTVGIRGSSLATATFDNLSAREAVADRSYRAAGASITGTLTRAQLASGTSLVGYSGFSAANYLREPYSADLDFGTGEWTASAWVNVPATLPDSSFPVVGAELLTNGGFSGGSTGWYVPAGWSINGGAATGTAVSASLMGTSFTPVSGRFYRVEFDVTAYTSGDLLVTVGGNFTTPVRFTSAQMALGRKSFIVQSGSSGSRGVEFYGGTVTATIDNVSVVEVGPAIIFDRSAASGPRCRLGVLPNGTLTAEAFDGTTTRTVTTSAAYNTAQWLKARVNYTTDGTLAILVNGREVATTRGAPLLTLNNASAVLTIGNSFALDAPFPGSIALLKLGATVPTPEQATFMFEQEKQLFRAGALSVLPDSGAIVDMAYDDATDRWVAISAANESYWTGLVRNSVQAVPAGSYSRVVAGSGLELAARTGPYAGVDVTIPAYGLREELVRRAEAAARLSRELVAFDFVGGFTANTTNGSAAITNVAGLTYPGSLIGARVSGAGIPANTRIVGVSGATIYLSAAATATATGVAVSFLDFNLPVAFEARAVLSAGALRREGSTADYTRLYDGFLETIRFAVAPGATAWVQIQATRGTMQ